MNDLQQSLARWANFYLLMAAAASTLIGLLFVLITLAAERRAEDVQYSARIRVYLTPTVVYFGCVLIVAALLTFPNHTQLTAGICICLISVVGLAYSGSILVGEGKKSYVNERNVIAHAAFPFAFFAMLLWGGALLFVGGQRGLTLVAVAMLCLLTIGVRNSWAIAVGIVSRRPGR
jgi:hypothetical protein